MKKNEDCCPEIKEYLEKDMIFGADYCIPDISSGVCMAITFCPFCGERQK